MTHYLTIHVRAHDGRYHGDGDELPSPFRLFQALVAGAGISGPLDERTKGALSWLEGLPGAPIIAAPHMTQGQTVTMFVPNNDLDKFGGDVRNIARTRGARKVWRPRHFDATVPWIYAWPFSEDGGAQAGEICTLCATLYQLGRGIDMAWAWGEILDEAGLADKLLAYGGIVQRPGTGQGLRLACPQPGSYESLDRRHQARRFRNERSQRVFVQQPKPIYRRISYESPPVRHVFELRSSGAPERRVAWPLESASVLVVAAREAARARLANAMPDQVPVLDRHLVGRQAEGSSAVPVDSRVSIIPIPSIGMHHADRAIRRLVVEVPPACPLRGEDLRWAFSGTELLDPHTGEPKDVLLSPTTDDAMLRHYGVGAASRVFRSVTPVVLPDAGKRRRIEPTQKTAEAKPGVERVAELSAARACVVQALRHAGLKVPAQDIRLQREPFDGAGSRVESFAEGTRFGKERLWHVEISFDAPVQGPLLVGDGRFLGLGLLAPARDLVPGIHVFAITSTLSGHPAPTGLARALRRAVMARVQSTIGSHQSLGPFFSGHAEDGAPIRRRDSSHLSFAFAPGLGQLLILAPHVVERRPATSVELDHLRILDTAVRGLYELRAGPAGVLRTAPVPVEEAGHALLGPSQTWTTITPYVVTRHPKAGTATQALADDLRSQCLRLGLPEPRIKTAALRGEPRTGLTGHASLHFDRPIAGPLLLGRTRHLGGGLFRPIDPQDTR